MNTVAESFVFKALKTGIELNLTGEALRGFVQSSTGCDLEQYEKLYQEYWSHRLPARIVACHAAETGSTPVGTATLPTLNIL